MPHFDLGLVLGGPYHDWLVLGFLLSLKITAITWVLALPLAVVIAMARLAPSGPWSAIASAYVQTVRNVPLLAHLLFWYFGAPELLPDAAKRWLYAGHFEVLAAVVALTLYTAAYMAEDIRSGVRSIPAGQFDAARALGFRFAGAMRHVVLPQAFRVAVPPLLSQTLNLWKDTSIATVIGVGEMMYQAARVESASFRSAEAFTFATLAYLAVSLLLAGLAAGFHRRLARSARGTR